MVILEIEKLSISDAGKYSCTAKNAFGLASSLVTLGCVEKGKLEQAPKFTSQLVVSPPRKIAFLQTLLFTVICKYVSIWKVYAFQDILFQYLGYP